MRFMESLIIHNNFFFKGITVIENKLSKVLSKLELRVLTEYLEGKSYTEIALHIGKSDKSIDNALQRIKKKIEKYIINDNE